MKKNVILCLLAVIVNSHFTKAQNNLWSLPPGYLDFPTPTTAMLPSGPYAPDYYMGDASQFAHNAMHDLQGNLLFFVVDNIVYDKNGEYIGGLLYNGNDVKGSHEIAIVPVPGKCFQYYIISTPSEFPSSPGARKTPYYSVLDLSVPNSFDASRFGELLSTPAGNCTSLASITPGFISSLNAAHQGGGQMAISKPRVDGTHLLFISNGVGIFRYKISGSGITYDTYNLGFSSYSSNQSSIRGEMELVDLTGGNYRIAVPYYYQVGGTYAIRVFAADLNASGTLIAGSIKTLDFGVVSGETTYPYVHGLEFSPDANILYITHDKSINHPNTINYYNFSTPAGIQNLLATNRDDFRYSQIERFGDKLYFATSNRLATLSSPNTPNVVNWIHNAISLPFTYPFNYSGVPTMDYNLKQYNLPDQVDGMDYFAHFTATAECCASSQLYNQTSFTASINATWTPASNPVNGGTGPVVTIKDQLVIPAGKTITIQNMTFKFAPNAKVVIERSNSAVAGGRLILNNTVFTADTRCGPMWQGVQVHGNTTNNQYPLGTSKQAAFTMINNSIVEHAIVGVKQHNGTLPYAGGIIRVTDSYFKNNQEDVEFWKYNAPNGMNDLSYFVNTGFTTNGLLNNPALMPTQHVYMNDVVGVLFSGCTFQNLTPALFGLMQRGKGIFAYNSTYTVNARCSSASIPCSTYDRGLFKDLDAAVIEISFYALRTINVERCDFINNNTTNIYISGAQAARITLNSFEVSRHASLTNYGLLMSACTGYKVEENDFTEFNDPVFPPGGNTYGIVVDHSGVLHNEIYKNKFQNIRIGGQAQGLNGEHYNYGDPNASNQGLQWRCNTFYNSIYQADIAISSGKIDYQQGYCLPPSNPMALKTPAGNKFSHNTFNLQNDIFANSSVLAFNYAHHDDAITTPLYYNNTLVVLQPCSIYITDEACPSKLTEMAGMKMAGAGSSADLDGTLKAKHALVDNGNTAALIGLVNTADEKQTEGTLLKASPYLGNEVLLALLEKKPGEALIQKIMLANSPLAPSVMEKVHSQGLSEEVIKKIEAAQTGISAMAKLNNEIGSLESQRSEMIDEAIRHYIHTGSLQNPMDSVAAILGREENITRQQQWCDLLISQGKTAQASDVLNKMEKQYGTGNYGRFAAINMALQGQDLQDKNTSSKRGFMDQLKAIATDDTDKTTAAKAQALLCAANNTIPAFIVEELVYEEVKVNGLKTPLKIQPNTFFKAYPNPAGALVLIHTNSPSSKGYVVELINTVGQKIQETSIGAGEHETTIDVGVLPAGVYIVKISDHNSLRSSVRLIVSH